MFENIKLLENLNVEIAQPMKTTKPQRVKKYWKEKRRSFFTILLIMLTTLIFKITGTVQATFERKWQEMESPYDIKSEYLKSLGYFKLRKYIVKMGFPDNNIISNFIKNKQLENYESVKAKVLEDDLILEILLFEAHYGPHLQSEKNNDEFNRYIIKNFDIFFIKKSKIKRIDLVKRFEYIYGIIDYFLANNLTNKDLYYLNFFEFRLRPFVEKDNIKISTQGKLILFTKYIGIITNKLVQKYKIDEYVTCDDPNYIQQKKILNKAKDFTLSHEVQIYKKDDFYNSFIHYINDFSDRIEKFDSWRCEKVVN